MTLQKVQVKKKKKQFLSDILVKSAGRFVG
jgi:hypothetical protein